MRFAGMLAVAAILVNIFAQQVHAQTADAAGLTEKIANGTGAGATLLLAGPEAELPLGVRYADLTEAQRGRFKAALPSLATEDDPPFPLDGFVSLVQALLPPQSIKMADGELKLVVTVTAQGDPDTIAVLRTPDSELAQIAARVLAQQRYRPGRCAGKPCGASLPVQVQLVRYDRTVEGACTEPPSYPSQAIRALATGSTELLLRVSPQGKVVDRLVTRSAGRSREHKLLDQALIDYVDGQTFAHGERDGVQVGGWTKLSFAWRLE